MAASSAEMTRSWVVSAGGTIPLPIVVATAVPVNAPATLRTPAMSTAVPGASTRVATEVAMALAVSWKPLMKSKTRATIRMSIRSAKLGMLHHDPFQRVGDVLGPVGGVLQVLINLSPADRLDEAADILDAFEQLHERPVEHFVSFILQTVDVYRTFQQVVPLPPVFQVRHGAGEQLRLVGYDARQEAGVLGWRLDTIEPDSSGRLLDGIDEVVESAGQACDVLAVERRDKGAVERVEDLVSDLVALVFEVA